MAEEMEDISGRLAHFTRELQNIFNEPYVKVILAKPKTTVIGLKGGYYHIVRIRPGTAAWVQPYEGPDGEWRDLDSGIVDVALQADMWNDRTQRQLRQAQERAEAARQRQKQREAQDRAAEYDARVRSMLSTQILVPRSIK